MCHRLTGTGRIGSSGLRYLLVSVFAGTWLGIPPIIYLMAVLTILGSLLQRRTAFGRMLYAIGTSPDAAYIAGLPVTRVTILCYTISGAAAGFAGILMVGFAEGASLASETSLRS